MMSAGIFAIMIMILVDTLIQLSSVNTTTKSGRGMPEFRHKIELNIQHFKFILRVNFKAVTRYVAGLGTRRIEATAFEKSTDSFRWIIKKTEATNERRREKNTRVFEIRYLNNYQLDDTLPDNISKKSAPIFTLQQKTTPVGFVCCP
jgi:hypothetical protein